jgi:hypothetical protein
MYVRPIWTTQVRVGRRTASGNTEEECEDSVRPRDAINSGGPMAALKAPITSRAGYERPLGRATYPRTFDLHNPSGRDLKKLQAVLSEPSTL